MVAKVVHGNQSPNHFNWSDTTQPSTLLVLLLELF